MSTYQFQLDKKSRHRPGVRKWVKRKLSRLRRRQAKVDPTNATRVRMYRYYD